MSFTVGNKAIRSHRVDGKDLLIFHDLGTGKGVRYVGMFDFAGWGLFQGDDKNNLPPESIV